MGRDRSFKKFFVSACTIVAVGYAISKLIKYSNEATRGKSKLGPGKVYATAFGANEFKPGRTFKGGEIRTVCGAVRFGIEDLLNQSSVPINVNSIMSALNIVVPSDYRVIIKDVSKCCAVADLTCRAKDVVDEENDKVIKIYISGFLSAICVQNE